MLYDVSHIVHDVCNVVVAHDVWVCVQEHPPVSRVMLMQINSFVMRARMIADFVTVTGFLSRSLYFLVGALQPRFTSARNIRTPGEPMLQSISVCLIALDNTVKVSDLAFKIPFNFSIPKEFIMYRQSVPLTYCLVCQVSSHAMSYHRLCYVTCHVL